MRHRTHCFRSHSGQVGTTGAFLVKINLLQRKNVRVQPLDAFTQPSRIDAVANGSAMQDVECRDAQSNHLSHLVNTLA